MNIRKRRRIQFIIIGLSLLTVSVALIGFGLRDGIQFFRSPVELVEDVPSENEVFRLGGLVADDSHHTQTAGVELFDITDGGATVPVKYEGILPDLFSEGQGAIVTGRYINGVFVATEVLAKHDEKYMPKEVADALKEQGVYRGEDATAAN